MNPPEVYSTSGGFGGGGGNNRPPPRKELQGPRPAVLKVNKDSYKIRKPPVPPPAHSQPPQEPPPPPPEDRQPVIIYAVSPKVIHTTVTDFMKLVQCLTGNASAAASGGAAGDLSPAARIASIEQTSTSPKDREIITSTSCNPTGVDDIMCNILEISDVEVGPVPGILSPAPATLQPISPGFFSPAAADPFSMMGYNNMFIPSPSALFSGPMVSPSALFSAPMASPSPSSCDLFNLFFDF